MARSLSSLIAAAVLLLAQQAPLAAENCSADRFGTAIDAVGAQLRTFNASAQPNLEQKLSALKANKGWTEPASEEKVHAFLYDKRFVELDTQSSDLLDKIDALGQPGAAAPLDCNKLAEIDATGLELLAVMKAKSAYAIGKIDKELAEGTPAAGGEKAKPAEEKLAKAEPPPKPATTLRPEARPPAKTADKPSSWDTKTAEAPWSAPSPSDIPGQPYGPPIIDPRPNDQGYTIDEIRDISRGFFGTISTSLASVLEYAFRKSGRPTGYVLGTEGGGAFLAGLRYGSGTLYLRSGGTEKVYWHGPSIGSDIGAEGSRTLFLVYRLKDHGGLYRQFTGIDGTAYFVGGVGITFLKGGEVIMAPIRSGLGFRLGASIGYVRFTSHPTWNPF